MIEEQREEREDGQSALAHIFSQEERVLVISTSRKRKYITYRSYMGGSCEHCDEPLGLIEERGGRDRHYCNTKCRVQHHRKLQREKQRAATPAV